jgi:aspartyl-tRNA synthetase
LFFRSLLLKKKKNDGSIQKGTSKACVAFAQKISRESLVDVEGEVAKVSMRVEGTTQQEVELHVRKIFVVSAATPTLPLQVEDCQRPQPVLEAQEREAAELDARLQALEAELRAVSTAGGEGAAAAERRAALEAEVARLQKEKAEKRRFVNPSQDTRLNHRILDLRTQTNHAIFRVQSQVCQLFREFLLGEGFIEIHTPKIIGAASEGGANVFQLKYFDQTAYLAQSPQLYKQMAVISDLERVFEIGPVFRAESSFTHRHLTEFTGLDLEMAFREHYHEVLELIERLFLHIFDNMPLRCARELDLINLQYPFTPLRYRTDPAQGGSVLRLDFAEGIALLRAAGEQVADFEDLPTAQERRLGQLVRDKYGVDFYVLNRFPAAARPFYTMPAPDDPRYTNSYDIFVRGEEIVSGSQRIHDAAMLEARAKAAGVSLPTIAPYLEAFKYGAPPHAGCGIGLERIVMLYLGLNNIRKTSMFPRDPQRISP